MFKVSKKDTRKTSVDVVLVSLLLTLKIFHIIFSVSIVDFEQVNGGWEDSKQHCKYSIPFHFQLKIRTSIELDESRYQMNFPERITSKLFI